MRSNQLRITYKAFFLAAFFIMFFSRILILTGNYNWPIHAVGLEIVYLGGVLVLILLVRQGRITMFNKSQMLILGILAAHTILWGKVFVDRSFIDEIDSHFRSQIMFVVIIIVTLLAVQQFKVPTLFLKCSYYALSAALVMQLVKNYSDLDLSNLANIMTVSDRTRANFGFGHYNTLGASCVCNILLWDVIRKGKRTLPFKALDVLIAGVSLAMLLCSASRCAITGLVLYYLVYYSMGMDEWRVSRRTLTIVKLVGITLAGCLLLWVLLDADFMELILFAQRGHLFELVLPMFFGTKNIMLGLGYASNTAYGEGLTPYLTRWLDSSWIYYMVSTGIVGLGILLVALFILGVGIHKHISRPMGKEVFAAYCMYVYISFFEAFMFNSGVLVNYVYIVWFLMSIRSTGWIGDKNIQMVRKA